MANMLNWFEIPVTDMERAAAFYGKIFSIEIQQSEMGGIQMGFLGNWQEGMTGALCKGEWYTPSTDGAILYLNGGDDLGVVLAKIPDAGGTVIMPKTHINDDIGYFAMFIDTEGNRMALHSQH